MKTIGREIGTLVVVVLKAKNLPNKRNIGKQDPYCLVTLNSEKQKTKVDKRGGQHPEWDEELRFTLFEEIEDGFGRPGDDDGSPPPLPPKNPTGPPVIAGGKFMKIACFADDTRDPTQIGETNVDLTEVLTKGETDEWFALSSKNKYAGEVYLELTFWSNEPAPKKKTKSKKNPQRTSQYGGAGSFVPFDSSPNGSHPVSRMPSSGSDLDQSATLRATNSSLSLDLYKAPYEKRASSTNLSVVDGVTKELNNLGLSDVRHRRDTFPPINQPLRSTSVQGFQPQSINGHGHNDQDQGSVFPVIQSHQPAYENTQSTLQPSSFQQQPRAPRYSLPNPPSSSGFATSSGFVPLNQRKQDPGLPTRAGPTPAPGSYGMTPAVIPNHTGFMSISSPTPVPLSIMPTSSSLPFQPGYHNPHYPMPYGLPPPPVTVPPPSQSAPQQQYPLPLPPNSSSPHQLTSSPIPEHGSSPYTPSPPQDAYSQLQGEQPASNPNSRPLPQPSMIARRRSTLPVPPGSGGINISPASNPSRPDNMYSGGNYQPVQPIQYNNIPPPPPLPSHFNTAPPQNQSYITVQAPPLPPPPPQRSLIHSHSHSHSLPNPPQPWATNGQHNLPIAPAQQNGKNNLPVPPVQQSNLPPPPATSPRWRLALPQPPTLPNPPTQQPIHVPPPPPLTSTIVPSYPNQLPQPPMQYAQGHYSPVNAYLPQDEGLYQQPTGTVWSYH